MLRNVELRVDEIGPSLLLNEVLSLNAQEFDRH